ncbi:MAG: 30S ribosomal protein S1, partial [Acidobacteriota bacterium]
MTQDRVKDVAETTVFVETVRPEIEVSEEVNFEELLKEHDSGKNDFVEGEVVKGRVLKVSGSLVVIDVGFKSEGVVAAGEFKNSEGVVEVAAGDEVDVLLESIENDGTIVLSREKAERMKIWDSIENAFDEQTILKGRVLERIKGGLAVDIGVRAFLPG